MVKLPLKLVQPIFGGLVSFKLLFVAAVTHLGELRTPLAPILVPPAKTRKGTLGLCLCEYFAATCFAKQIAPDGNLSASALVALLSPLSTLVQMWPPGYFSEHLKYNINSAHVTYLQNKNKFSWHLCKLLV